MSSESGGSTSPEDRNDLNAMTTAKISIDGQAFEVWLATDPVTREKGLMHVTQDALAPRADGTERGMLFVFGSEQLLSFWMLNTVIPLDIAYISQDGRIVKTYTMAPRETRIYPSIEPARFALEVSAGLFDRLGITAAKQVEIPDSVLKDAS